MAKLPRLTMQELPLALEQSRAEVKELAFKLGMSWGLSDQEFKELERTYQTACARLGKLDLAAKGDTAKLLKKLRL